VALAVGLTRELRVPDRVVVPRLPRDEPGEPLTPTLDEIEPLVLAERGVAVGAGGDVEQLGDRGDVAAGHLTLDLEPRPH
jgi:hypothetical protein